MIGYKFNFDARLYCVQKYYILVSYSGFIGIAGNGNAQTPIRDINNYYVIYVSAQIKWSTNLYIHNKFNYIWILIAFEWAEEDKLRHIKWNHLSDNSESGCTPSYKCLKDNFTIFCRHVYDPSWFFPFTNQNIPVPPNWEGELE